MIYHNSGSYIQVDSSGTTTNKATNDKYDINENNMHVYVGGRADVSILGDAYVKVGGSKIEEVMGDYKRIVHGNYELNVAGYGNFNISDEAQIRGARVAIEAKVEDVTVLGSKNVSIGAMEGIYAAAGQTIGIGSSNDISIKSTNLKLEGSDKANIKAETVSVGGGGKVNIKASVVAIDDVVQLANDESDEPEGGSDVEMAGGTQMAEPAAKGIGGLAIMAQYMPSSVGVNNVTSRDDYGDSPLISDCSTSLVDAIKGYEGFSPTAYEDHGQLSIGYGLRTNNPGEVIDEAEATRRLVARLNQERSEIQAFSKQHGYNWNDCQIDSLASFRYNNGSKGFLQLTANGTRDNETIANKMLEFNKAKDRNGVLQINSGLVERRRSESNWFRNGSSLTTTDDNDEIEV